MGFPEYYPWRRTNQVAYSLARSFSSGSAEEGFHGKFGTNQRLHLSPQLQCYSVGHLLPAAFGVANILPLTKFSYVNPT